MKFDVQSWTESQLNSVLDLQASIPGIQTYFEKFKSLSNEADRIHQFSRHLYGDYPSESYLLATPAIPMHPEELVVFIHGGYWRAFTASDFLFVGPAILSAGYSFASVDYPVCPDVTFTQVVHSTYNALHAIAKANPGKKMWLVGHSAGAHLAMMSCCLNRTESNLPIYRTTLVSGLFELAPLQRSFLQPTLRLTQQEVDSFSPVRLKADPGVSYDVIYGKQENVLFQAQSREMTDSLAASKMKVTEYPVIADHFNILFTLFGTADDNLFRLVGTEK